MRQLNCSSSRPRLSVRRMLTSLMKKSMRGPCWPAHQADVGATAATLDFRSSKRTFHGRDKTSPQLLGQ